jgi:dTDP-4-dehydrorhamnose reductase
MRWIVTGSGGQLGRCLVSRLRADPRHELVRHASHAEIDIADPAAVAGLFEGLAGAPGTGPVDVLANAAAFTAVDRCESEPELAKRVNADGPRLLATRCRGAGVRMLHVSTDYVFDGRSRRPYREEDATGPRTVYGRSKLAGERAVLETNSDSLVVRTSWVFGPGRNFVGAILRQAWLRRRGEVAGPLKVVDDQSGCPTYAADLAEAMCQLAAVPEARGLLHLCNEGAVSWWDFARAILDLSGFEELGIDRIRSESLKLPAERPPYSVLDCTRAAGLGVRLRPWREALASYLESPEGLALREEEA